MDHKASAVWARMGMQPSPEYFVFAAGFEAANKAAEKSINLLEATIEDNDKLRDVAYNGGLAKGRTQCIKSIRLVASGASERGMDVVAGLLENIADALTEGLSPEATLLALRRHETRQEPEATKDGQLSSGVANLQRAVQMLLSGGFSEADIFEAYRNAARHDTFQEPAGGPGVQPPPAASEDSSVRSEAVSGDTESE